MSVQIGGTPDGTAIVKMGENKSIAEFNSGICGEEGFDTPKASNSIITVLWTLVIWEFQERFWSTTKPSSFSCFTFF